MGRGTTSDNTQTAYLRREDGFEISRKEIDDAHARGRSWPRSIEPAYAENPDGSIIPGISYMTDYVTEEESGVGELRRLITSEDPRRFQMTTEARRHIAIFADQNALAISQDPVTSRAPVWGEPVTENHRSESYSAHWDDRRERVQEIDLLTRPVTQVKLNELREMAGRAGLPRPWPRSKEKLIEALASYPGVDSERPDQWPADFDYGRTLVIRADGDSAAAKIVAHLREAAEAGTLGIGNSSGAFRSGLFLYDTRDESPELVAEREREFDWRDEQLARLEPVKERLRAAGYEWFALGRPRRRIDDEGNESVIYWLNGSTRVAGDAYALPRQPSGWYTLEELESEKFAADARRIRK